jgi:toxin ParE1/3/4
VSARRVHYTSLAYEDLTSLLMWIATERGLELAEKVDAMLERAIESLARMPDRGRMVSELRDRGYPDHRELVVRPYRLVYYAQGREVWIVAILDGRRQVEDLLLERARRAGFAPEEGP